MILGISFPPQFPSSFLPRSVSGAGVRLRWPPPPANSHGRARAQNAVTGRTAADSGRKEGSFSSSSRFREEEEGGSGGGRTGLSTFCLAICRECKASFPRPMGGRHGRAGTNGRGRMSGAFDTSFPSSFLEESVSFPQEDPFGPFSAVSGSRKRAANTPGSGLGQAASALR